MNAWFLDSELLTCFMLQKPLVHTHKKRWKKAVWLHEMIAIYSWGIVLEM